MNQTQLTLALFFLLTAAASNSRADCLTDPKEYAAKLETCTSFTCQFIHPFSGTKMTKKIVGLKEGKCQTTEEMPNKGMLTCNFSESQRKAVAQFIRKSAKAETWGTDDKSPLNDAMQDGTCVVSGY